jgi:hypothetical protein
VQPEDVFCPHCGRALDAGESNPVAQIRETLVQETSPVLVENFAQPAVAARPIMTNLLPVSPPPVAATFDPHKFDGPSSGGLLSASDCSDLEVRYNNSCVFVLNMQSTFDFEIRPLADGLKKLFVEVRLSGQTIAQDTLMVVAKRGSVFSFGLNYIPRNTHSGKGSFTILVGYFKDGHRQVYAAFRTHTIYSGKEDPRRVCENLVVEVKNNIQQGHAGDLKVDQSFSGLREALRQHDTIEIDKEFLGIINARPIWTPLALAECEQTDFFGKDKPSRLVPRQRFELRAEDGTRISLFTQPSLRLGRHRDCEILARLLDGAGQELRQESMAISQYHALIEWQGDRCRLKDGGQYPQQGWRSSSAGVWVDGHRVSAKGEFHFVPGREHRLTLGDPGVALTNRYELTARLWSAKDLLPFNPVGLTVESPHSPACLVLRRLSGPGWVYVLVRAGAALVWADDRCGQACVGLAQGALQWSEGRIFEPLVAGHAVRAGALNFQVLESPVTLA